MKIILLASTFSLVCSAGIPSSAADYDSAAPRFGSVTSIEDSSSRRLEPSKLPDYATNSAGTALQAGAESTTLPVETRLKLVLETPVDAQSSRIGDIFEAHVRDDLFVGMSLLLPRGSLVRGRIDAIQRARLMSKAAKVELKLDQIVTPTGEVIPLDAQLTFQKGKSNTKGQLDPGTSLSTRVRSEVNTVTGGKSTGTTHNALIAANVATLGAPAIATMIGGSTIALFRSGDNVNLQPGEEIDVLLTNDLGLQIN